jgi:hypothetical protein
MFKRWNFDGFWPQIAAEKSGEDETKRPPNEAQPVG